ncbi:hypothetical protein BT69DRAFT_1350562 [Atractiella rhizophila]|nr:hypothetical protein BT69DRAFT_1350562 [Atractiella rhizophila]
MANSTIIQANEFEFSLMLEDFRPGLVARRADCPTLITFSLRMQKSGRPVKIHLFYLADVVLPANVSTGRIIIQDTVPWFFDRESENDYEGLWIHGNRDKGKGGSYQGSFLIESSIEQDLVIPFGFKVGHRYDIKLHFIVEIEGEGFDSVKYTGDRVFQAGIPIVGVGEILFNGVNKKWEEQGLRLFLDSNLRFGSFIDA